ncbi:hypothetical protein AB3N59_05780 [Leptospira sp. WS92.C1]
MQFPILRLIVISLGVFWFLNCSVFFARDRAHQRMFQAVDQIEAANDERRLQAKKEYDSLLKSYLEESGEFKNELRNHILAESARRFNSYLSQKEFEKASLIAELFGATIPRFGIGEGVVEDLKTGNQHSIREYFAADLIAYAGERKDFQFLPLIHQMIPNPISDPRLAFDLACLHALNGNKKEMLQYMKIAIFLGKPAADFDKDADFHGFRADPDYIRTLWEGPVLDPSLIPPASKSLNLFPKNPK